MPPDDLFFPPPLTFLPFFCSSFFSSKFLGLFLFLLSLSFSLFDFKDFNIFRSLFKRASISSPIDNDPSALLAPEFEAAAIPLFPSAYLLCLILILFLNFSKC